jgi:hypothetical protein
MTKRQKLIKEMIDLTYNSASSIRNYIMNDPVLDYIKVVINPPEIKKEETFLKFIMKRGEDFEKDIVGKIEKIVIDSGEKFVKVTNNKEDIMSVCKFEETVEHIKNKVAVIYQGTLHGNDNFKSYGSPDLIVRKDIVKLFIDNPIMPEREDTDYIIIDIKYSTLKFNSAKTGLLNDSKMAVYKSQVIIYNTLLGLVLGHSPEYCYLLGKGWKNNSSSSKDWKDKLGPIDVFGKDSSYQEKITNALVWLEKLKKNGKYWNTNPPSVPELYPNMCNKSGKDEYLVVKNEIAKEIEEITQIWNIGPSNREIAHMNGIYKLSDPNLTAEKLGLKQNSVKYNVIDKMLKLNQGKMGSSIVIPNIIKNNTDDWQNPSIIEFFLDFETINISNGNDHSSHDIFMAGLGVNIRTNGIVKWKYFNFRVPDLLGNYDEIIFNELYEKIEEIVNIVCIDMDIRIELQDVNIYHWGSIENTIISKIYDKYQDKYHWLTLNLVDLNRIFVSEPIIVKDVYNFGLKSVGNGFINNGLIESEGWSEKISNGLDAMITSFNAYKTEDNEHILEKMKDIIKYNEMDVRIMEKIIDYLRKNKTINI